MARPKKDSPIVDMRSNISLDDIGSEISGLFDKHIIGGEKIDWNKDSIGESTQVVDKYAIDFSIQAPNIIEWSTSEKFLKQPSLFDYKRQYQTIRDLFQLRCPLCNKLDRQSIDCWDKGREYLESENLLAWSPKYHDDVCPACNTTRREFETDGIFKRYNTFVACVGMRSGKSVMAGAYLGTYIEHLIITLGNPSSYFDVFPGQPFEVAFTATTEVQSEGTIYAYYRAAREQSPWVQAYIEHLKQEETRRGLFKQTLYNETNKTIYYKELNTEFNSLHSNSGGLAGRTRVWAVVDELSRFETSVGESRRGAKEVYNVIDNGLATVRGEVDRRQLPYIFGMMNAVSSPIHNSDMTMKLLKTAKKDKNIFAVHYPTWKFNPKITRESLESRFQRDPTGAERDFGANPPNAEMPLITDEERFRKCINPNLKPKAIFEDTTPVDGMGRMYAGKILKHADFDRLTSYYIAGDAGKSKDSFALACGHGEYKDVHTPNGIEKKWCTIMDWCVTVRPSVKPRKTIYYDCIVDILNRIKQRQKIQLVAFDHWNSEAILQDLSNMQIETATYNVKAEDALRFVIDAYESKVQMIAADPNDEYKDPYSPDGHGMSDYGRAIHELLNLERSADLKTVDHRSNEHNDVSVCLFSVHKFVQESMMTKGKASGRQVLTMAAQSGIIPKISRVGFFR